MFDLLNAARRRNLSPKKVASTNGGEYACACPKCEGKDRFRIWPNATNGGRYWCRQCGTSGDLIQFLRDFLGMSFQDAKSQIHNYEEPIKRLF